jgi:hypothetical protein
MKTTALSTVCALSLGVVAAYGETINENDLPSIGTLGINDGADGQVFAIPPGNGYPVVLDDWTFYLQNTSGIAENFYFYFLQNGNNNSLSIVWQSSLQTVTASDSSLTAFTVYPDYTMPVVNNGYVMAISELGLNGGPFGGINFAVSTPGIFVYDAAATAPSDFSTDSWGAFIGLAMTYNADFTAVPDGSNSVLLMSLGIGGIAAMRRWLVRA